MIRLLTATLAAVSLLVSCMQMDDDKDGAVGYLAFPQLEVDATVEDLTATRSMTLEYIPSVADLTVTVTDAKGKTHSLGQGSRLTLPVGAYTITALYGSNSFDAPYFQGTATGSIQALQVAQPQLRVSLKNSLVKVSVGEDLAGHFTKSGNVSFSSAGTAYEAAYDTWVYVPSGADLTVTLKGTNVAAVKTEMSYVVASPAAATAYSVTAGLTSAMPNISIDKSGNKIGAFATRLFIARDAAVPSDNIGPDNQARLTYEISPSPDFSTLMEVKSAAECLYVDGLDVAHTYYVRARIGNIFSDAVAVKDCFKSSMAKAAHFNDASGDLAGTNVTIDYGFTGYLKTLYDNGKIIISAANVKRGTELVRSLPVGGSVLKVEGNWPYLPQSADGSAYSFEVSHSLVDTGTVGASAKGIVVAAPGFTFGLTSYSSYDKYLEGDSGTANSTDALTIKNLGASWTISATLIGNSNYAKSFSYNNNGASSSPSISATSYSLGDKGGLTVGTQYKVSASFSFDGVSKSDSKTHYITGLPYSIDIKSANPSGWNLYNASFDNGRVYLEANRTDSKRGYAISPKFYIPDNINVSYKMIGYFYCSLVNASACKIWVEPTSDKTTKSQSSGGHTSNKGNISYPSTHGGNSYEGTAVLSSSKPYMCVSQNCSSATLQTRRIYFYGLTLEYR